MNNTPFLSIITASYNSEKTIAKTIQSILDQSYTDFEYIIVDGNSKDATLSIIQSFESKFKEKSITYTYISEPDKGIYDAWNKGLAMAKGNWISFIGSDDFYLVDALSIYIDAIDNLTSGENYISSKVMLIDEQQNEVSEFGEEFVWKKILNSMDFAQVGSFHKRQLFNEVGDFSLDYKIAGDLDFYIRTKDQIKPAFINVVTGKMMNNGVSNQIVKALTEGLKIRLKHHHQSSVRIYLNHYYNYFKCYGGKIKRSLF